MSAPVLRAGAWGAALALLLALSVAEAASAESVLSPWQELAPMPGAKYIHQAVVVGDRLYAIAGGDPRVFHAQLAPDGSLGAWQETTPLDLNYPAVVVRGRRIYVVTGLRPNEKLNNMVYYGDVAADGSVPAWVPGPVLPEEVHGSGAAVLAGDYLYYVGGFYRRQIYRAPLLANGDLGVWERLAPFPTTWCAGGIAAWGGSLYVFGGYRSADNITGEARRAAVGTDGGLGPWRHTTGLPEPASGCATAQLGERLFVLGVGALSDRTYTTRILADGELAPWSEDQPLPASGSLAAAAAYGDWVYLLGGLGQEPSGERTVSNRVYAARLTPPVSYALRFRTNADVVESLGGLQLKRRYRPSPSGVVCLEAEQATRIQLAAQDMAPVAAPEASGGLCLQHISELEAEFVIERPGEYRVWYRGWFPRRGHWNHSEQMDEGEPLSVTDSESGPTEEWLWTPGPPRQLAAGAHMLRLPAPTAWRGGTWLDKLVIAPTGDPAPTGLGPEASPAELPARAELISNRFRLDDFAAWRLAYQAEGPVGLECSYDKGQSWQPVTVGADTPITPETRRVLFRVRLSRGEDGATPRVRGLALELTGRRLG